MNKKEQLTERQEELLLYINESIEIRGFPPSYREMADKLDISSISAINGHLLAIEKKGWIKTTHSVARGIKVL